MTANIAISPDPTPKSWYEVVSYCHGWINAMARDPWNTQVFQVNACEAVMTTWPLGDDQKKEKTA